MWAKEKLNWRKLCHNVIETIFLVDWKLTYFLRAIADKYEIAITVWTMDKDMDLDTLQNYEVLQEICDAALK